MSEESKQLPEDKTLVSEQNQDVAPELVPGAAPELIPAVPPESVPAVVPESVSAVAPTSAPEISPEHQTGPASSTIKWNQNKKIPRIFPGIVLSIIITILMPISIFKVNLVLGNVTAFVIFLATVYWTFCVFRLTGQLQYKSKALKVTDRILALMIPLLGNPGVLILFLGMALAVSAMLVAAGFRLEQDYVLQHPGPMATYATVGHLLFSIACLAIPLIGIPTICMGWTYKFMVKVASVNEPIEKSTFWKTRGPAILVLVNTFICVEGWLYGLLSIGSSNDFCLATAFLGFLTCGLCQVINFFVLWLCVQKKQALSTSMRVP